MNKNNKGFTVVELVVSFTITLIVILLLFQLIISLKDLYTKDGIKTELLIKQGLMTKKIADSFEKQDVKSVSKCPETNCYKFTFIDNSVKDLKIDITNNTFQYGEYKTKLVDGSKFRTLDLSKATNSTSDNTKKDSILSIKLPITNSLIDGDYGVKIVFLYNSNQVAVSDLGGGSI